MSSSFEDWPRSEQRQQKLQVIAVKTEAQKRKTYPMFEGLMKYFPDALAEVSNVSFVGNEQHNPGQPLHWDRSKSTDEDDAMLRHVKDRAKGIVFDTDGVRHRAKAAWRALAALQKEIEESENAESGHQKSIA